MRLKGGRTGKRAVVCERPRADRADEALRPRGLVRRAGGRARLQRLRQVALPAAAGRGRQRPRRRAPPGRGRRRSSRCRTRARPSSAPGCARAGSCRPTSTPSWSAGPCSRSCTAATAAPDGAPAWVASRPPGCWTATSSRTPREQQFESLSGGQQARFQILLLELSGPPCCCSTSRPTTSTCSRPRRWRTGLEAFEGTVLAVTHDRWFARGFDRFLVYGADGEVYESDEPVWDEGRVAADAMSTLASSTSTRSTRLRSRLSRGVRRGRAHGRAASSPRCGSSTRSGPRCAIPTGGLPDRAGQGRWRRASWRPAGCGIRVDNTDLADVAVCTPAGREATATPPRCSPMSRSRPGAGAAPLVSEARPYDGGADGTGSADLAWAGRQASSSPWSTCSAGSRSRSRPELDALAAEAASHHEGYRLRSFTGAVPDDLLEGWARLSATLMTEAPRASSTVEEESADRARSAPGRPCGAAGPGRVQHGRAGPRWGPGRLHRPRDHRPRARRAYQWGTLVRPDHRGHRLGLAVKVANVRLLQASTPDHAGWRPSTPT